MSNIFSEIAKETVKGVRFRSQLTPEYSYDPWAASPPRTEPGVADWIMRQIKPEVTIETAGGPITVAPYGAPTEDLKPKAAVIAGLTVLGVVTAIGWIARKL